ncbi:hypothetical protein I9W82_004618 [Candida metapsilosis]|uniref:Co-chaperone HscB C-terminal oligomerisation domain-containing protein n=1 Tax=Candida metapsilosis TaxID=273372 RepID=A0A8H7ZE25_9ASCO|nr:hypothetical protein I9W82_004618 [Candida metapsilosis]
MLSRGINQLAKSALPITRRWLSTEATPSYFKLFPHNFPHGGPPKDPFYINERQLRKEYRTLQGSNHPDVSSDTIASSNINQAFTHLRNPYLRLAHLIKLMHGVDITDDAVSKSMIAKFQNASDANAMAYKAMLLQVMEAHEQLEFAEQEQELDELEEENNDRIKQAEEKIESELKKDPINWDELITDAIKLKYWVNIQNGIKDWEPGKPVHLTH